MKKTITTLYCDRCDAEGKETGAATVVWIRTLGMPRIKRQDVCDAHYTMIVGTSSNGATRPTASEKAPRETKPPPGFGPRSKVYSALVPKILAYAEKHPRFSLDHLLHGLGQGDQKGKARLRQIAPPLRMLVGQGKLERVVLGVYQRPGHKVPEPDRETGALLALKMIKAEPGVRSAIVAPMLGIPVKQWKPILAMLRERGVKTKGVKSAAQLYPPKS